MPDEFTETKDTGVTNEFKNGVMNLHDLNLRNSRKCLQMNLEIYEMINSDLMNGLVFRTGNGEFPNDAIFVFSVSGIRRLSADIPTGLCIVCFITGF